MGVFFVEWWWGSTGVIGVDWWWWSTGVAGVEWWWWAIGVTFVEWWWGSIGVAFVEWWWWSTVILFVELQVRSTAAAADFVTARLWLTSHTQVLSVHCSPFRLPLSMWSSSPVVPPIASTLSSTTRREK